MEGLALAAMGVHVAGVQTRAAGRVSVASAGSSSAHDARSALDVSPYQMLGMGLSVLVPLIGLAGPLSHLAAAEEGLTADER